MIQLAIQTMIWWMMLKMSEMNEWKWWMDDDSIGYSVIHLVIHHQRKTVQHVSMVETGPASYSGRRWNDRLPSDLCWCTPEVSSMSPPSACHWQCARHRRAPLRCCFEWRFAVLVFHGFLFVVDLSDFNSCGPAGCVFVFFDFNWFMIIKLIDHH